jgi:hypothetical protein
VALFDRLPRSLSAARTGRRSQIPDLDRRQPAAPGRLPGAARGQAGRGGPPRSAIPETSLNPRARLPGQDAPGPADRRRPARRTSFHGRRHDRTLANLARCALSRSVRPDHSFVALPAAGPHRAAAMLFSLVFQHRGGTPPIKWIKVSGCFSDSPWRGVPIGADWDPTVRRFSAPDQSHSAESRRVPVRR